MKTSPTKCSGCGICVALCPYEALKLKLSAHGYLRPSLNEVSCSNCNLCRIICPSEGEEVNACREERFANPNAQSSLTNLIGNYLKVGLAWSTDTNTRYNSASGGAVTSLLKYLLEEGFVDAVLIPRVLVKHGRVFGRYEIVSNPKKIIEYAGSIYAPTYISEALKTVIREKLHVALVGLPCQIRALRRASRILPTLRENIRTIFGLYCYNLPSSKALGYAIKTLLKVDPEKVYSVSFRGFGWPGYTTIITATNKMLRIPSSVFYGSGFGQYFYAESCFLCSDHAAELADISFADPWTYQRNIGIGKTLTVVRTEAGFKILEGAIKSGYLIFEEIPALYAVQYTTLFKKAMKATIEKSTSYTYTLPPSIMSILHEIDYWLGSMLARDERLWFLLRIYVRVRPYLFKPFITLDYLLKSGFTRVLTKFSKTWVTIRQYDENR